MLLLLPLLVVSSLAPYTAEAAASGRNRRPNDVASFVLFDNGSSSGGVDVSLSPDDFRSGSDSDAPPGEAFAVDMSRLVDVSKYMAPKPVVATRAFREDGELITKFEQLLPAEDEDENENGSGEGRKRRVYLVANGLEFVWPFVELGHLQRVSPNVMIPLNASSSSSSSSSGGGGGGDRPPVVIESMSESPRVFRIHNMCTPDESRSIIENALSLKGASALHRSTVGEDETTDTRTSENAWDSDSDVAKALISRSFRVTNIEENPGKRDGLQIVRYKSGQGYNTHPDYFENGRRNGDDDFDFNPYSGGSNRFATVFIYLNDVPENQGGFTVFPRAPSIVPVRPVPRRALEMFEIGTWQRHVTEKCYTRLAVPPALGTAALFYSITPDGRIDSKSHHAACPLIGKGGEEEDDDDPDRALKWGANIWLWNRQRYGEVRTGDPRSLLIRNECDEDVYLTWEGRDNGVMEGGRAMNMNTYEFHRFKAHFRGYKEKAFAEYTVESEPSDGVQTWTVRRPRVVTFDGSKEEL